VSTLIRTAYDRSERQRLDQELEARVRQRTHELEEANRQLRQKTRVLERLALTDPLTGLPNRRAIDRLAKAELKRHNRYHAPLALVIIDIDHFKEVNRRYLLTGGDHILCEVADTLGGAVRTVDTVGRIGGEEFLVVAPETDREGAAALGARIRSAVENARYRYRDQSIAVTVSVGIAVAEARVPAEYDPMKHLAAAALGEAKSQGRNRCVIRAVDQAPDGESAEGRLPGSRYEPAGR
jgi:diguanylate cyclase (GGDEF)-like protein